MAEHTPGPWEIRAGYGHAVGGPRDVILHQDIRIAVVSKNGGADSPQANARLIAAAPDLLEALGWCADHAGIGEPLKSRIRAAIKRAKEG